MGGRIQAIPPQSSVTACSIYSSRSAYLPYFKTTVDSAKLVQHKCHENRLVRSVNFQSSIFQCVIFRSRLVRLFLSCIFGAPVISSAMWRAPTRSPGNDSGEAACGHGGASMTYDLAVLGRLTAKCSSVRRIRASFNQTRYIETRVYCVTSHC